mmetsp:Transcript_6252/g.18475  ORF Transcript_6252/g.18475 Transcript_6252/m.18475 type:complete len:262 (-) Transcript_6252:379-1164(-)
MPLLGPGGRADRRAAAPVAARALHCRCRAADGVGALASPAAEEAAAQGCHGHVRGHRLRGAARCAALHSGPRHHGLRAAPDRLGLEDALHHLHPRQRKAARHALAPLRAAERQGAARRARPKAAAAAARPPSPPPRRWRRRGGRGAHARRAPRCCALERPSEGAAEARPVFEPREGVAHAVPDADPPETEPGGGGGAGGGAGRGRCRAEGRGAAAAGAAAAAAAALPYGGACARPALRVRREVRARSRETGVYAGRSGRTP